MPAPSHTWDPRKIPSLPLTQHLGSGRICSLTSNKPGMPLLRPFRHPRNAPLLRIPLNPDMPPHSMLLPHVRSVDETNVTDLFRQSSRNRHFAYTETLGRPYIWSMPWFRLVHLRPHHLRILCSALSEPTYVTSFTLRTFLIFGSASKVFRSDRANMINAKRTPAQERPVKLRLAFLQVQPRCCPGCGLSSRGRLSVRSHGQRIRL